MKQPYGSDRKLPRRHRGGDYLEESTEIDFDVERVVRETHIGEGRRSGFLVSDHSVVGEALLARSDA